MHSHRIKQVSGAHKPRLEPIFKLLNQEKYEAANNILDFKAEESNLHTVLDLIPFVHLAADEKAKEFTRVEIGNVTQWLANNKHNFNKIFATPLGKTLSRGICYPPQSSPILAALENHPDLLKIINDCDFPEEQIGGLLQKFIITHKTEKAIALLDRLTDREYENDNDDIDDEDQGEESDKSYVSNIINYIDPITGNNALHLACTDEKSSNILIHTLVKYGGFLTDPNYENITPLDMMINKGIDIGDFLKNHIQYLSHRHLCHLILELARKKMFTAAKTLLHETKNCQQEIFCAYDNKGKSILHYAMSQTEDMEFTRMILQKSGKTSLQYTYCEEWYTPLIYAINYNNDSAIKLFFELCLQKKSARFTHDQINYLPATKIKELTTATYDLSERQAGIALYFLITKNKINFAIDLLQKRPDTNTELLEIKKLNNLMHLTALSDHPQKEILMQLLCKSSPKLLSKKNAAGETPMTILRNKKEFGLLTGLFNRQHMNLSLKKLTQLAHCLIKETQDMQHLSNYLLYVQEHPLTNKVIKQKFAKDFLLTLINNATAPEQVRQIIAAYLKVEKKITFFYQASAFWHSVPTGHREVMNAVTLKLKSFPMVANQEINPKTVVHSPK